MRRRNRILAALLLLMLAPALTACEDAGPSAPSTAAPEASPSAEAAAPAAEAIPVPAEAETTPTPSPVPETPADDSPVQVIITVDGQDFPAELNGSPAAEALAALLPLTVEMTELNGNEKYYDLAEPLPADDRAVENVAAGDLMLYRGDCLVLFYESFSTGYEYTPLGRILDPNGLAEALGNGDVTVSFRPAGAAT